MLSYDNFLDWAAEYHYSLWLNDYDFNDSSVAWGCLSSDIINTAAAIYNQTPFDLNQSFRSRLADLYGNPLTKTSGTRNASGW